MKHRILVVEDNRYVRENTIEMLDISGYEALSAADGRLGYEVALHKKPDLILCDISMPDTNGPELVKMLKANPGTRHIPLILVSAHSSPVELDDIHDPEDYLRKPFTHEELMAVIERVLPERLNERNM